MQALQGEEDGFNEITEGGKEKTTETERQTDLAVLVGVFLHPHPGQVDLGQRDTQLETIETHLLSWQHTHHRLTVSSLWKHNRKGGRHKVVLYIVLTTFHCDTQKSN